MVIPTLCHGFYQGCAELNGDNKHQPTTSISFNQTISMAVDNDISETHTVCPLAEFGCNFKSEKVSEIRSHIKDTPVAHLSHLCDGVLGMGKNLRQMCLTYRGFNDKFTGVERKVSDMEHHFGLHLVWKIDAFGQKFQAAQMGMDPVIFSPPFYTGRQGYKLAVSACLNGDGKARGQFISLFLTILKGEFDNLLLWPFSFPVRMAILDQNQAVKERRNVVKVLNPNTHRANGAYIGKPLGERNPSFGLQCFCPHIQLGSGNYVVDDCMFVRVEVDMEEMLKF